jgi:hypothetical protein
MSGKPAALAEAAQTTSAEDAAMPGAEIPEEAGQPSERAARTWTKRAFSTVGGIILATGVVGTVISAYFQWRSWEYQSQTDKIDKDAGSAVTALQDLDKVIDEKFLSTYDMNDAIKTRLEGKDLDDTVTRFYLDNKSWEQQHAILSATLEIAVDSQFGIVRTPIVPQGKTLECNHYLLKYQQPSGDDPLSVRNLLEIAYSCHTILKNRIDDQIRARKAAGGRWPEAAAEPDPGRWILGHVWRLDNVLQCMMVERVLELRHQSPHVPLIPVEAQVQPYLVTRSERANEGQCVAPYKNDADFGANSQKPN